MDFCFVGFDKDILVGWIFVFIIDEIQINIEQYMWNMINYVFVLQ